MEREEKRVNKMSEMERNFAISGTVLFLGLVLSIAGMHDYDQSKQRKCDADPVCVEERETARLTHTIDSLKAVRTADSLAQIKLQKAFEIKRHNDSLKREIESLNAR